MPVQRGLADQVALPFPFPLPWPLPLCEFELLSCICDPRFEVATECSRPRKQGGRQPCTDAASQWVNLT